MGDHGLIDDRDLQPLRRLNLSHANGSDRPDVDRIRRLSQSPRVVEE